MEGNAIKIDSNAVRTWEMTAMGTLYEWASRNVGVISVTLLKIQVTRRVMVMAPS